MTNITIFEPETSSSLFSSQDAMRIAAVMEALEGLENYEALLFNLTDDAEQFTINKAVNEKIDAEGNNVLPITVVDGAIVKSGSYPTNDEITSYIGVRFIEDTEGSCGCGGCGCGGSEEFAEAEKEEKEEKEESGCCGGKGGCGCGGHGHHHHHKHTEAATASKGSCSCGQGGCC
ncbi:hypothetical protein SDC9_120463 [bioreactor metagenome]|uniref:Arsenical resistance operon trans-acting repressor ArsD n=1 Tax=bioreactor metagenome TaxID=1076179 RepID=A0A645C9A8_9ZZZZ